MFEILTFSHSILRWLVLISLLLAVFRAYGGFFGQRQFSREDNAIRHWTATIAHIQLTIGIILYTQSPLVKYFWTNFSVAVKIPDALFFGLVHIFLMLSAIVLLTIGSALAKRKASDRDKFKTMLTWFTTALILILIAVPWPFYPFAARPFLR